MPKLQPLDAGIIGTIKQRYIRRQIQRGIDLIEIRIRDKLYNIDLKLAITWIYDIWYGLPNEMILMYQGKTSIIDTSDIDFAI